MQVASVLGSPRKKGNTNRVLTWVEEALHAQGHRFDRINIVDYKINGCKGCYTCEQFTDKPGCPQEDDALEVLGRLMAADAIVYASPVYMWGPTSQIKAIVDRHCCLVTGFGTPQWDSLLKGKLTALVITCADEAETNADLMMEMFKRFAGYLQSTHTGALVIPLTTTPDAMGDDVREQAVSFAHRIAGLTKDSGTQG